MNLSFCSYIVSFTAIRSANVYFMTSEVLWFAAGTDFGMRLFGFLVGH